MPPRNPKREPTQLVSLHIPETLYQEAINATEEAGLSFAEWVRRAMQLSLEAKP